MTPSSPSSTPPGPVPRRRSCRTPYPGRKSRSGSTASWTPRTGSPENSTGPMWERPCGSWRTGRAETRTGPSPAGRRGGGWSISAGTAPSSGGMWRRKSPAAIPGRCSERHYKETDVSRETRGRLLTSRRRVQREKRRRSSRASTCRAFSA